MPLTAATPQAEFALSQAQSNQRANTAASFEAAMTKASATSAPEAGNPKLRQEVRKLVSTAFLTPLFTQLRTGTGFAKDTPFQAGMAENSFHQMLDQMVSDRLIQRMDTPAPGKTTGGMPMVEQITQHLARYQNTQANAQRDQELKIHA